MKPNTYNLAAVLAAACLTTFSLGVRAAATQAEVDRLGKDLTPTGAEKAGNKDGSIPAWSGGLAKPPVGWKPEQGYVDPFANEKPLFTITAANADQYKDKLSAGELALLKKYPNFVMPVYPSHRTAALPGEINAVTKAEAAKISMKDGHIEGRVSSHVPFPFPKTGEEVITNHLLRYIGGGYDREYAWFPVRPNGDSYKVGYKERVLSAVNLDPLQSNNFLFAFSTRYTSPATLEGTAYLVHDYVDSLKKTRDAWIYNAGLRRVRRAPDVAFDNVPDGVDGLRTSDQFFGYNGSTERYDWKLVGKKEIYVPYNAYKISDKKLKYADILDKNTVKSELMRYELHRAWVVEATLKSGQKHIYAKRTMYLDEDSWILLMEDAYDSRGELWRAGLHAFRQVYDALVPWHAIGIWHDLSSGAYLATNMDNEVKAPVSWNVKDSWSNFQPDALRRSGVK